MVRFVEKGMKLEQVWHQVKNNTAGLELKEQMWCGMVLQQQNLKALPLLDLHHWELELTHSQCQRGSVVLAG